MTFRESLFFLRIFNGLEGSACQDSLQMSGSLVFQLVFNDLRMVWTPALREALFSLWNFNVFEGSPCRDALQMSGILVFQFGFQWFAQAMDDRLSRIIDFPKEFQWF